jgi:hypothetical protein
MRFVLNMKDLISNDICKLSKKQRNIESTLEYIY